MSKVDYYAITKDGYDIIGYGYYCVVCCEENNFVVEQEDEQGCRFCGHITSLNPIPWRY